MSDHAGAVAERTPINWKRIIFLFLGIFLFVIIYYSPPWPDAVDPMGKHFPLTREAKGALAVFMLAGTWWVFEVLPIGVTSIAIGVLQALFLIRTPEQAFTFSRLPNAGVGLARLVDVSILKVVDMA